MKKVLIGAIALLATTAIPAMAADMAVKAPPVVAPVPTWTGFYIGVNGGGAWGSVDPSARDIGPFPDGFFAAGNIPAVNLGGSQGFNASGGLVGGQIGYLFQTGKAIFGVEASFDWTSFKGSRTIGPTVYPVTP